MKKVSSYKYIAVFLAIAIALVGNIMPVTNTAQAQDGTEDEVTTVWQSDESPTGYYVTFRYKDADATRVRIYGEWAFSDLAHASVSTSLDATPEEWQDGYTVWTVAGWPTADMTKDEETGIWSYTIPLPNGTWNYRFYVGGAADAELTDYTDAVVTWDPNNVPMLYDYEAEDLAGEEYLSSIYVPWDAEKQANTTRFEEEAPRDGENGEVLFSEVTNADGFEASFGIYLPYEFDAEREEPYPVLVIMHGGGGTESSWLNNGLVNILDNMIAEGRLEPTIVVTPNGSDSVPEGGSPVAWDRPLILDNVVNYILPYMVENYNVSEDVARRAFAGLSMGGATTMYAYFHNTDDFQYFIPMSPPLTGDVEPDYTIENLSEKTLFFGYGMYDFVKTRSIYRQAMDENGVPVPVYDPWSEGSLYEYLLDLGSADIPFMNLELPYGHTWTLWRQVAVYVFDNVLWK